MLNKVILIGNLGRDPEVRSIPSGRSVANFSLATNEKWTDSDGNRQEKTEWHRIVVWGRQAEVAGQYLSRGKKIYLEGKLQTRSWDDRQSGEKRYMTEVVCDRFLFLSPRSGEGGGPPSDYGPPSDDYGPPGGGGGGGGGGDGGGGGGGGSSADSGGGPDFGPQAEDDDIPF